MAEERLGQCVEQARTAQSAQLPAGSGTGSSLSPCAPAPLRSLCSQGPRADPRDTGNKVHAMFWPGSARQKVTKGAELRRASGGEAQALGCPSARSVRSCPVPTRSAQQEGSKGRSRVALSCLHVRLAPVLRRAAPARPGTCACHRGCSLWRFVTRALALPPAWAALPARCWPPGKSWPSAGSA